MLNTQLTPGIPICPCGQVPVGGAPGAEYPCWHPPAGPQLGGGMLHPPPATEGTA